MNNLKIISGKERKEIENLLKNQFGIKNLNGILVKIGEKRIFLFQGSLDEKQLISLDRSIPIERAGVYLGKLERNEMRLSIEGSQILKNQITKNIVEVNAQQAEEWMMGHELLISSGKYGFVVIKYKNDFLGCGKASQEKITNYIPKNRRLKDKSIIKN